MRTFSTKKLVVTAAVATVLVGTGTAAFACWTSQGTGTGTAATASSVPALTVEQLSTPSNMYPGDSPQALVVKVSNPGQSKAQVFGVRAVATVTPADGAVGPACAPTDYQVNGSPIAASGIVDLNWTTVELASTGSSNSVNTVSFNDTTANQNGCKGATLVFSYTAQ